MKRRTRIVAVALGLGLLWATAGAVSAETLPHEPGNEYLLNEGVDNSIGLYFREYSIARNGVIDYRTARQILFAEYDEERNTQIQAEKFPLFYWYDKNQDGRFEMWVDRKVEGCLCDIVRYQP